MIMKKCSRQGQTNAWPYLPAASAKRETLSYIMQWCLSFRDSSRVIDCKKKDWNHCGDWIPFENWPVRLDAESSFRCSSDVYSQPLLPGWQKNLSSGLPSAVPPVLVSDLVTITNFKGTLMATGGIDELSSTAVCTTRRNAISDHEDTPLMILFGLQKHFQLATWKVVPQMLKAPSCKKIHSSPSQSWNLQPWYLHRNMTLLPHM